MPDLASCLQVAMDAGELDQERGRQAQERYREIVSRNVLAGLPEADAKVMATNELFDGMFASAAKKRHVSLRQLQTAERNLARYTGAAAKDPKLISRDLEKTEREWHALRRQFWAGIGDFLENFHTNVRGQVQRRALLEQVVRELHGEATGSADAEAIAKGVRQAFERARALFNAWGGDIGKLDDFGLPHEHDANKVRAATFEAWANDLYDKLDWSRITNYQTGKPFVVAKGAKPFREDADRFLNDVYDGIISNGWNTREPSFGVGGKALYNTRSESRILHFLSADDWMAYNDKFGKLNPFDTVTEHINGMARDIALMRNWGPNPSAGLQHALQIMEKEAATARGLNAVRLARRVRKRVNEARTMMDILTGRNNVPGDELVAHAMATTRSYLTTVQLGSAILSQPSDHVTSALAAHAVGMNPTGPLQMTIKSIAGGATQQQARDMGWILDTWADAAAGHARYLGDVWTAPVAKRMNSVVLRSSGLNFATDYARQGVAMAFMSDLADAAGKSFAELHPELRRRMAWNGIGAKEWDALRDPTSMFVAANGSKAISPTYFLNATGLPRHEAEDIATKYGALIEYQLEYGVPTASLRGRAAFTGAKPGTVGGESLRSTWMYKSFSMSLIFNLIDQVQHAESNWNRFKMLATFMSGLTAIGALGVQLKQVAAGHDPLPMDDPRFWGQAFAQGGGLGIFGDFLRSVSSRSGGGLAQTAAGPVVGLVSDVGTAVVGNTTAAINGKPTHFGRDLVNLARRYNPTSTLEVGGVIPVRLAMDRLVWDQLQFLLDPEAVSAWRSAENRLRAEYSTRSWWDRGSLLPSRGPDLSNAVGGNP